MNVQNASTRQPAPGNSTDSAARAAKSGISWSADPTEREWERSLFMVPQRLAEARRRIDLCRGAGGLLLASIIGFAILVGDARGEETPADQSATSEAQAISVDYWTWLHDWIVGGETTDNQKSGGSSNDPEGGED